MEMDVSLFCMKSADYDRRTSDPPPPPKKQMILQLFLTFRFIFETCDTQVLFMKRFVRI